MTGPPTPGRSATEFLRIPERKKNAIMHNDPQAALERLQAGWNPTHDVQVSGAMQEDATKGCNEQNHDLVMTDRVTGKRVANIPQPGQSTQDMTTADADDDTEDKDTEDGDPKVEDDLKEAAHKTQLHQLQEPSSNYEEVLHDDPNDAYGEHPSYRKRAASAKGRRTSSRRRRASSRRRSDSAKSKYSTHSIKGIFSYAKNKHWHSSPHSKKPGTASKRVT